MQVAALKADGFRETGDVAAALVELGFEIAGLENGAGLLEVEIGIEHFGFGEEGGLAGGGGFLRLADGSGSSRQGRRLRGRGSDLSAGSSL